MKNKPILHIILALLLVAAANAEKYFVLDVNHALGSVTFNSISLKEIDRTIRHDDKSGFLVKAVSFENADTKTLHYNMSENRNYFIYIPYDENAARIEVYSPQNSLIMELDVSSFADTCGNGICDRHESRESCTKDCPSGSKDDFCDEKNDGICDPDCAPKSDADCKADEAKGSNETAAAQKIDRQEKNQVSPAKKTKGGINPLIWILLVSGGFAAALLLLLIRKIKEDKIVNSLKQYANENLRKGFTEQQIKDTLFRAGYKEKEVDKAIKST